MNDGYVKKYRGIMSNFLYPTEEERAFTRLEAWDDLIMRACYAPHIHLVQGKPIKLSRSELCTSEKALCERWKWSKSKLRDFITVLISENMLTKRLARKKTVLNICNYEVYQGSADQSPTVERPQNDRKPTVEKPKTDRKPTVKEPTKKEREERKEITLLRKVIQTDFSDKTDFLPLLEVWFEYMKSKRKAYKDENSAKAFIKRLLDYSGGDFEKAQAIIDNAMACNWQSVHPLKESKATPKKDKFYDAQKEEDYASWARD